MLNVAKYVPQMKRKVVNLDLLFNTKQKNKETQTSTFMLRNSVKINKGTENDAASCNGVPMTCNAGEEVPITAVYPLGVNEVFADCAFKEVEGEARSEIIAVTTEEWALTEATYGYSTFTGTDITTEANAPELVNIQDQIALAVNTLIGKGYSAKDIIVAINEKEFINMQAQKLTCCDLAVQTSDARTTASTAFGIKAVVSVPAIVLSGQIDGVMTPEEEIKFRAYVPELHPLIDYCKTALRIEDYSGSEHSGVTRIYGKELLGAGEIQAGDSETHVFYIDPAPIV